ncbi:branched-chain amino acid ABC transporter permease [Actinokineospora xionganensis]|uniref:Branched-chain amino acid ABC transporter permease n=1 Tax=Actinokineospora xionganensis TaxID=2684470 RepID=A0ABR7LA57_9PSEU|nr:branched-chain amino acid ABC transporter permease [Actinokineospora xionganensis]MBC6449585.1 branched-chain amino acid ABC transporter permease [Actinokineospora xionganensis]
MSAAIETPPETPAEKTAVLPTVSVEEKPFRPGMSGVLGRGLAWAAVAWLVLAVPGNHLSPFDLGVSDVGVLSTAAIFAIIGLSLNVLIGYAGTISLGHQAFVGIGAFTSAFVVTDLGMEFWLAVPIAAIMGGVQAALLGAISLRLSGLYFALVTLAYGMFAEESLFGIAALTGGEGGKAAPRPIGFETDYQYYYVCLAFLALVWWLDLRLTRTKGGRALQALRENPRVASSYGINVKAYTMLAFVVSGVFAAIGGSLLAHHDEVIVPSSFDFELALLFVLMTVVGGLRNRLGVVLGSVFFALLGSGFLVEALHLTGFVEGVIGLPKEFVALVIGPILLLLTITRFPGGIGQQVAPVRGWMLGGRFDRHAGAVKEIEVNDVRA